MQLLANLGVNASTRKDSFFIEPGLIVMWYGTEQTVPNGWALCDGTNGNPDLRDKFIIGAGDTYSIGDTGGSADTVLIEHTHTGSTGTNTTTHTHTYLMGTNFSSGNVGSNTSGWSSNGPAQFTINSGGGGAHGHSNSSLAISNIGVSATNENLPPYYSLFFIIKEDV